MNIVEKIFETILWRSRLIVIFAVIASLVSALIMIAMGCYEVVLVVQSLAGAFASHEAYEQFNSMAVSNLVSAVDDYLIGTVFLIFAAGIYELFISKIDIAEKDTRSSKVLIIHDLDQLKEKIAKVIIMVLIVTFFKYAVDFKYNEMIHLLYLSIGILLIAVSIYLTHKGIKHKSSDNE